MDNTQQPSGLVILFDDERSFVAGFRDDALVLRTVVEAIDYFAELKESGQRIAELWLDFVLSPGSTCDALYDAPGYLVDRAIYHSSAYGGRGVVEGYLQDGGFTGEFQSIEELFPEDPFPRKTIFG